MDEQSRIGLTAATGAQLDELLEALNPDQGTEGVKLIKKDLYRLAVALGLKKTDPPPQLKEKSNSFLRVSEVDGDGVLYLAVEHSDLLSEGGSVYELVERLAESGIREFYSSYQTTGQLPLDQYFDEKD